VLEHPPALLSCAPGRHISVYKHFSDAGKVCINTSPAPETCFQILLRFLRRRRSVFKYVSGAEEVDIYLSDASPALKKPGIYIKKYLSGID